MTSTRPTFARNALWLVGGTLLVASVTHCTGLPAGDILPDAAAGPGASPMCDLARPPEAPAMSSEDDASQRELVFALRTATAATSEQVDGEVRPLGYDLDSHCTVASSAQTSCQVPQGARRVVDGPQGRDYTFNGLYTQLVLFDAEAALALFGDATEEAATGQSTILIRVGEYNGQPNDREIDVALYSATLWDSREQPRAPRWDGSDAWRPISPAVARAESGELDARRPRYQAADAYVVDGTLVMRFDKFLYGTAWSPLGLQRSALLTGKLEELADGRWTLRDGVLASRWPADSLIALAAVTPEGTCRDEMFLLAVRDAVCGLRDISSAGDDGDSPCDALSTMYTFQAESARLGTPLRIEPFSRETCEAIGCDGDAVFWTSPE